MSSIRQGERLLITQGTIMKKFIFSVTAALALTFTAQAEKTGKEAYEVSCKSCHGDNGAGGIESGQGPNLTVLKEDYFRKQFKNIREGKRKGPGTVNMNKFLDEQAKLTDAELELAIKYALELPKAAPKHKNIGDVDLGRMKYAICGTCHGPKAEGYLNPAVPAPGLVGQPDWYIVDSLNNFKIGHRGSEDPMAMQMKAMTMTLPTEKDFQDVAAFIRSLEK
jgi:cytochrome c553